MRGALDEGSQVVARSGEVGGVVRELTKDEIDFVRSLVIYQDPDIIGFNPAKDKPGPVSMMGPVPHCPNSRARR